MLDYMIASNITGAVLFVTGVFFLFLLLFGKRFSISLIISILFSIYLLNMDKNNIVSMERLSILEQFQENINSPINSNGVKEVFNEREIEAFKELFKEIKADKKVTNEEYFKMKNLKDKFLNEKSEAVENKQNEENKRRYDEKLEKFLNN